MSRSFLVYPRFFLEKTIHVLSEDNVENRQVEHLQTFCGVLFIHLSTKNSWTNVDKWIFFFTCGYFCDKTEDKTGHTMIQTDHGQQYNWHSVWLSTNIMRNHVDKWITFFRQKKTIHRLMSYHSAPANVEKQVDKIESDITKRPCNWQQRLIHKKIMSIRG